MAYVKDDGIYRCRLQLDEGHPCIDVIEHFAWDAERKCLNESKPLGGLQIILRADAYKVMENGELSTVREDLALDNFGVTIITPSEQGEEVKADIVANFVRIFGLRDVSELLTINSVDAEQLINAVFDVRVTSTTSKRNGKSYRNYWFAPVGEADYSAKAFSAPSRNKATFDKYRAKLRVECKGITGVAQKPTEAPKKPSMPSAPSKPTSSLPPRAEAPQGLDLNAVWELWIKANPDDIQGAEFYECINAMYPNREASTLNAVELSAFCNANSLNTFSEDDYDNLPY